MERSGEVNTPVLIPGGGVIRLFRVGSWARKLGVGGAFNIT